MSFEEISKMDVTVEVAEMAVTSTSMDYLWRIPGFTVWQPYKISHNLFLAKSGQFDRILVDGLTAKVQEALGVTKSITFYKGQLELSAVRVLEEVRVS